MEVWCVGAEAYIGPYAPRSESNASGGVLSFCGERKGGKNAVKTKVLKSFPRLKCCLYRSPSATRIKISKFRALLSHGLCVYICDALRACAGLF